VLKLQALDDVHGQLIGLSSSCGAVSGKSHCANPCYSSVAFTLVQALDDVQGQLDGLSSSCGAISGALASARATASGLLADSDKAGRELAALEAKRQLVEQFLDKYQLTPEEVGLLGGYV
jgi:hypothetical protein